VPAVTKVGAAELTTTEGAVLALLAISGERSGYDLQKLAERAVGHVWAPAKSGLYAVLPRLVSAGLAARRKQAQPTRPDKHLYRITGAGRAALDAWLTRVEPGARETFFLKLFVGGLTSPEVVLAHVAQFTADAEERLARLRAIEPSNTNRGHDWFHRHMLRYGIEHAERELEWAAGVTRALKRGPR
jgi:PadR family transcriptional regulator AphA